MSKKYLKLRGVKKMPNIENLKKYKNIHMIGIGGVSMSGIAAILTNWALMSQVQTGQNLKQQIN